MVLSSSAYLHLALHLACEQRVDIIFLDFQLIQDKFLYKSVLRAADDLLRFSELGDLSFIDNHNPVRKRQGFLRIVGDNDCCQIVLSWRWSGSGL